MAIFSSRLSISYISRSLILAVISFMWIIGMIDAYIDSDWFFLRRKIVIIYIAISILPSIFIIAFSFLKYFYLAPRIVVNDSGEALVSNMSGIILQSNPEAKKGNINVNSKANEKSEPSKFYIQVAVLKDQENVEKLRKRLEKKGYNVVVEPVKLKNGFFHKVTIDGIQDEKDARIISDRLTIEENINVIIHRR